LKWASNDICLIVTAGQWNCKVRAWLMACLVSVYTRWACVLHAALSALGSLMPSTERSVSAVCISSMAVSPRWTRSVCWRSFIVLISVSVFYLNEPCHVHNTSMRRASLLPVCGCGTIYCFTSDRTSAADNSYSNWKPFCLGSADHGTFLAYLVLEILLFACLRVFCCGHVQGHSGHARSWLKTVNISDVVNDFSGH